MNQQPLVNARSEDFEPLLPIDIISPPQLRGEFIDRPDMPTPHETPEMVEAEIQEKKDEIKEAPDYKGDMSAPIDAPHPLAEAPPKPESPL